MSNRFIISDTHFGHKGIVAFTTRNGAPLRPWDNIEDHDQALIENWNAVVRPEDSVYHLGDFCINRKYMAVAGKLNGRKKLVRGNHDVFKTKEYMEYFDEIYGSVVFKVDIPYGNKNVLLTHIPVHEESLERWVANFHGHTHDNAAPGNKYVSFCVEKIKYTPCAWEDAIALINLPPTD